MRRLLWAVAAVAMLAACDYGQSRSSFQLKVAGKTLEEAREAAGKPVREEKRGDDEVVLVYEKKTFDSENMNAKDGVVRVTFKKDAKTGKYEYWGIEFVPET
jgi:hypothetical protein